MPAAKRRLPADPNRRAHAIGEAVTGAAEPKPLPAHVAIKGDVATCGRCGKTFTLAKRSGRDSELRAFASIHAHAA